MSNKIIITESQLSIIINEAISSGAVLLRTMTRKSVFHGGKYDNVAIQELLDAHKNHYLRWVYFNMSNISYTDEILEELKIFKHKIPKPGKDPEYGEEVEEHFRRNQPLKTKMHIKKVQNDRSLFKGLQEPSLFRLALKNQGHNPGKI
jgi:hypothetical protein